MIGLHSGCNSMLRRDLLRALVTTLLAGWLGPWMPRAFGIAASEEPNAAAIYRRAFGWAEGLSSGDRERLRGAATIPLDDRRIDPLLRQAAPALEAIREAASIGRCHWGIEVLSCDDLGKDRLGVFNVDVIRVACLSARRHAARGRGREAL